MTTPTIANVLRVFNYGRGYSTIDKSVVVGAGVGASLPVPGSRVFRLTTVTGLLATSAAAGNRGIFLEFQDNDGTIFGHFGQGTAVGPNLTRRFTFSVGGGTSFLGADNSLVSSLPDVISIGGNKYVLGASGLDGADQFSALVFYYDQIMQGGDGYNPGLVEALAPVVGP